MNIYLKSTSIFAAAALLAASSINAQTTTTDPVGYVTLNIAGTGGVGSEAFSYLGAPLHNAVDSAGSVDTDGANTIQDTSQSWTVDAYAASHYVQITSGASAGVSATIASNTADTLTTVEDLDSLLSGGETFEIRAYTTIADVFGPANEAGLDGGSSAANADTILIQNGASFDTYYYKDSGLIGGTGWRQSTSTTIDTSATPLPYADGFIVVRKQSPDLEVVVAGSVFGGDATSPIESAFNWKTTSIPVTVTFGDLFGAANEAGLDGGSSAANADNIYVPNGSGGFNIYYYKDSGLIGGTGWRISTSTTIDQTNTVVVAPGQMFLINRSGGGGLNLTESSPL